MGAKMIAYAASSANAGHRPPQTGLLDEALHGGVQPEDGVVALLGAAHADRRHVHHVPGTPGDRLQHGGRAPGGEKRPHQEDRRDPVQRLAQPFRGIETSGHGGHRYVRRLPGAYQGAGIGPAHRLEPREHVSPHVPRGAGHQNHRLIPSQVSGSRLGTRVRSGRPDGEPEAGA
ncbi:hypothetical protein GCM10027203_54060 [Nonomuraea fastidiosa]|jgi:hypothetical protein